MARPRSEGMAARRLPPLARGGWGGRVKVFAAADFEFAISSLAMKLSRHRSCPDAELAPRAGSLRLRSERPKGPRIANQKMKNVN